MSRQFLPISQLRTAARCWVPVYSKQPASRFFSSRQRFHIDFNNVNEHDNTINLISNDDVFTGDAHHDADMPFEPTVFSLEEVTTAGPVNKA